MNKLLMPLVLLSLLSLLFACGGGDAASIEGSWKISEASLEKMSAETPEAMREQAKEMARGMTMTFAADGKCTFAGVPLMGTLEGTYEVTKTRGKELTVKTVMGDQTEEQAVTLDGDELTMEMEGQSMTWTRQ